VGYRDLSNAAEAARIEECFQHRQECHVVTLPVASVRVPLGRHRCEGNETVGVGARRAQDGLVVAVTPPEDDGSGYAKPIHHLELRVDVVEVNVGVGERYHLRRLDGAACRRPARGASGLARTSGTTESPDGAKRHEGDGESFAKARPSHACRTACPLINFIPRTDSFSIEIQIRAPLH
jgi:hypothetical protein